MKKFLFAMLSLSLAFVLLCSCGGETAEPAQETENEETTTAETQKPSEPEKKQNTSESEVSYDGVVLYEDENYTITLEEISNKGISFTFDNKTYEPCHVRCFGVALDGQICDDNNITVFGDVAPDSISDGFLRCDLENTSHKTISGAFSIDDKYLSFEGVEIGDTENLQWEPEAENDAIYSDEYVSCYFKGIDGDHACFEIVNECDKYLSVSVDAIAIDRKEVSDSGRIHLIPGTSALLDVTLAESITDYEKVSGSFTVSHFEDPRMGFGVSTPSFVIE